MQNDVCRFQFIEQAQGRTSIRGNPCMCVLRYCVPNKGLHPLRRESGYPLTKKGVTFTVTPFTYFTVLRTLR